MKNQINNNSILIPTRYKTINKPTLCKNSNKIEISWHIIMLKIKKIIKISREIYNSRMHKCRMLNKILNSLKYKCLTQHKI